MVVSAGDIIQDLEVEQPRPLIPTILSQDCIHTVLCPAGHQTRRETAVMRGDPKITPPQHGHVIMQAT